MLRVGIAPRCSFDRAVAASVSYRGHLRLRQHKHDFALVGSLAAQIEEEEAAAAIVQEASALSITASFIEGSEAELSAAATVADGTL